MNYNNETVKSKYITNLNKAIEGLKQLDVYCNRDIKIKGLNRWVLEQTIQSCIKEELTQQKIPYNFEEQFQLQSRIKVDLKIDDKILIEIKVSGIYSRNTEETYMKYKKIAEEKNFEYVYITLKEGYEHYHELMRNVFGNENAFFLDTDKNEWERFINRIINTLT